MRRDDWEIGLLRFYLFCLQKWRSVWTLSGLAYHFIWYMGLLFTPSRMIREIPVAEPMIRLNDHEYS